MESNLLEIFLDSPSNAYYAGQRIIGQLRLTLSQDRKLRSKFTCKIVD